MRVELDRHTTTVDGYFVLDFISVDRLLADGADLAGPFPGPHAVAPDEDSALKPTANGEEHPSAIIIFGTA